jgi:hypothetical protein
MLEYWLPYQATFHVYDPGVVGAGALSVTGHNGAFTGGLPVPVLLASSTPFWPYRSARARLALPSPPLMTTLTDSPGAYDVLFSVPVILMVPPLVCVPCLWHIPQELLVVLVCPTWQPMQLWELSVK